jgi:hypothetical protein
VGQLLGLGSDRLGDAVQQAAPVGGAHPGPLGCREGGAGRGHRVVHVGRTGQGDLGEGRSVRRVEDGEGAAVGGGDLLAVEQQLAQGQFAARFRGHGRISPSTVPKMTTSSPGWTVRIRRTQSTMPSCGARTSSSVLP